MNDEEDLKEPTADDILAALDAAGVDNWDGYDIAMSILRRRGFGYG